MKELYDFWLAERLLFCQKDVCKIIKQFDNAQQVYETDFEDGTNRYGISEKALEKLNDKRLNNASLVRNACEREGISIVTLYSKDYPELLRDIECPPYMLFIKGDASVLKSHACISMVGTRTMSVCGKYSAFKMSYELAKAGLVVVSGMALGIDSMSHAGALAARGRTIAVLGSGVDVIYPKEHAVLYDNIIRRGGAVISEYFPGYRPTQWTFPARNRIISGLSRATIIVEAAKSSGSLITASQALKEGRTVFAMPGYAYSLSTGGTNDLIRGGALPVTDSSSVLSEYAGLSNVKYRYDYRTMGYPTVALCDDTVRFLKVSTRAYNPATLGPQPTPEEIMMAPKDAEAEFPFKIRQTSEKRAFGKRSVKSDAKSDVKSEVKEETVSSDLPARMNAKAMMFACEQLGFELTDGMKKVCEHIAGKESVTVEELHREGCSISDALQTLSLLTQTDILKERTPGRFEF